MPTTYADAIQRLNSKSLKNTLEVICLFSSVEFASGASSPVFPLLNSEKVRLLGEAAVISNAAWYKARPIVQSDLRTLLNGAGSALDDRRLGEEVVSGGERQEMLYRLQRFFARMAYIQIRPQESPVIPLGQLAAVIEVLPADGLKDLPLRHQESARRLSREAAEVFGGSARKLLETHVHAVDYFGRLGTVVLSKLPSRPPNPSVRQQSELLFSLLAQFESQLHLFCLAPRHLERIHGEAAGKQLERYSRIFAKGIREHRKLLAQPPYRIGPEGLRLSSLDRFPLVAADQPQVWYVPNVRGLARTAPDVLHFTLNEGCREAYERARGPLLELYLANLVSTRAPNLRVIPEGKWRTRKGEVAGPDLTLIEHGQSPVVVGIEVKYRRMLPSTRFELLDEDLTENYKDLWKAIRALPEKLRAVFNLEGDYREYRDDLLRAKEYPRFNLGLAGEAPFMFGELASFRAVNDEDFPLHGFNDPWLVMTSETFERFVEVTAQHDRPLVEVLAEYQEDCANLELSGPMASSFRHAELDESQSYAATFLAGIWPFEA